MTAKQLFDKCIESRNPYLDEGSFFTKGLVELLAQGKITVDDIKFTFENWLNKNETKIQKLVSKNKLNSSIPNYMRSSLIKNIYRLPNAAEASLWIPNGSYRNDAPMTKTATQYFLSLKKLKLNYQNKLWNCKEDSGIKSSNQDNGFGQRITSYETKYFKISGMNKYLKLQWDNACGISALNWSIVDKKL